MKKRILTLLAVVACIVCLSFVIASCGGSDEGGGNTPSGPTFTVTFDPNGGTLSGSTTVTVQQGQKISAPTVTRDGYILTGWYSGPKASSKWDFETNTVEENITLKAWWRSGGSGGDTSNDDCVHDWQPNEKKLDDFTQATCTRNGKEYYKCTKCLLTETRTIPATGHNKKITVVEPTCATEGYTTEVCLNENCTLPPSTYNKKPATGLHDYDIDNDGFEDFDVIVKPTTYTPGTEAKTCEVCGGRQIFTLEPASAGSSKLYDLVIDNYLYKGQPYVNIAGFGGISVSSYYRICVGGNINDGDLTTYWSADTLADGSKLTGDTVLLSFDKFFEIGAIKLTVPFYTNWELGADCYVSYDVEAFVKDETLPEGGKWISLGVMSDKDASSSGINGTILLELPESMEIKEIKATVNHSTRFASAMIYEMDVFANVENQRVADSLLSETTASVSGKFNAYASGASALVDNDMNSYWFTDWRHVHQAYATLEFPGEKFVASVQFATPATGGRKFALYYFTEGEWVEFGQYTVPVKQEPTNEIQFVDFSEGTACLFTIDTNIRTSKLRLEIKTEPDQWNSKVISFAPYTVYELAYGVAEYTGCTHQSMRPKENGKVESTCTEAGYTVYACQSCGFETKTDAVHATGHTWGAYEITTAAANGATGIKTASCVCGATKQKTYSETYEEPTFTTYYKNAPSAWVQTYDDGNYIEACLWSVEQFKKYNYKATMNMAITYSDGLVKEWQDIFATGYFDLGSHSYNHAGIYSGSISEFDMQADVDKAHYWFMDKYHGQQILTFATPNGSTSIDTADYVTYLMASGRNGGGGGHINYVSDLKTTVDWGNINCYASKSSETEGNYVLVANGSTGGTYKATANTYMNEKNEEMVYYTFEWVNKGSYTAANLDSFVDSDNGEYILIHNIAANGTFNDKNQDLKYKFVKKSELVKNYVFDDETLLFVDENDIQEGKRGSYHYDPTTYLFTWVEGGSYDFDPATQEYTFKEDGTGKYQLLHTGLGSYEKVIEDLVAKGAYTIECIHSLEKETYYRGGLIHSSYVSTISKYEHLKKLGIWVCSYTQMTQYLKETLNAHVDTKEITDTSITLSLTDNLTDYMFNHPVTIKVDIPDAWTNVTVMQGENAIELVSNELYKDNMLLANCTIIDGYLYVDAVPDCGDIVITVAE